MTNKSSLQRSTKDQIEAYLDFVKQYPELKLTTKLEPADMKRNDLLWTELTAILNALKGPKRSREKWRQSLTHWRNQIRSRARKEKAANGGIGCPKRLAPRPEVESFETELRNIALIQNEIVKIETVSDDEQQGAVISEPISDTEMRLPTLAAAETPHAHRTPTKLTNATKRQEMLEMLIGIMRDNEERDKRLHEQTMNCFQAVTDSINNLTNAVTALTEAIIKRQI